MRRRHASFWRRPSGVGAAFGDAGLPASARLIRPAVLRTHPLPAGSIKAPLYQIRSTPFGCALGNGCLVFSGLWEGVKMGGQEGWYVGHATYTPTLSRMHACMHEQLSLLFSNPSVRLHGGGRPAAVGVGCGVGVSPSCRPDGPQQLHASTPRTSSLALQIHSG